MRGLHSLCALARDNDLVLNSCAILFKAGAVPMSKDKRFSTLLVEVQLPLWTHSKLDPSVFCCSRTVMRYQNTFNGSRKVCWTQNFVGTPCNMNELSCRMWRRSLKRHFALMGCIAPKADHHITVILFKLQGQEFAGGAFC